MQSLARSRSAESQFVHFDHSGNEKVAQFRNKISNEH